MIKYFLNLLNNLKTDKNYNVVEEYKNSTINLKAISWVLSLIKESRSFQLEDNLFRQQLSKNLFVVWQYSNNKKIIKEIKTSKYSMILGAKAFIIKPKDNRIKDIRFDLTTGIIKKINFVKSYFIRFVDFCSGKVAMGISNFKIKEFFDKSNLSELSEDEWDLLELNTIY